MKELNKEQLEAVKECFKAEWNIIGFESGLKEVGLIGKKFTPGWYRSKKSGDYFMYWGSVSGPTCGLTSVGTYVEFDDGKDGNRFDELDYLYLSDDEYKLKRFEEMLKILSKGNY